MNLKNFIKRYFSAGGTVFAGFVAVLTVFLLLWVLVLRVAKPVVKSICIAATSSSAKVDLRDQRVRSVEAETTKFTAVARRVDTVGVLRSNATVNIKSEMAGSIKEVLFNQGSIVQKGDLIIKFQDDELLGNLQQAEGELELSKTTLERTQKLYDQKAEIIKNLEEAKARFKIAQGKVLSAKANLDKAHIIAPFSGLIGLIAINPGSFVQGATDLVTIVDNNTMRVHFKVPEKNANEIGIGQVVEVKVNGIKDTSFKGEVVAVDSKIEIDSHSIQVHASISNESNLLKEGMFASVSVVIGEKQGITIDESALERMGEIEYVWVVEKGRADRKRVLTGYKESGRVEIVAGLTENQLVVTSGQLKLSDGCRVNIQNLSQDTHEKNATETESKQLKKDESKKISAKEIAHNQS